MTTRLTSLTFDAKEPLRLARFWAEALGWDHPRPVDVDQGEVSWVVLADPDGNDFCVMSPRWAERDV